MSATGSGKIRWADDIPVNTDDARGRIVAAAVECIRRVGVDKTGMDDVAKAAGTTRQTVYKYFSSRNELMVAVFLRLLDAELERGLSDFVRGARTVADLQYGIADACVYLLGVLRSDDAIQALLFGSRIPVEDLLREAAGMLVGAIRVAITDVVESVVAEPLLGAIQPFDLEATAGWTIRVLYAFLAWPGEDAGDERELFRSHLSPLFVREH